MEKSALSPPGYCLYKGTTRDRRLLVDFLERTYQALFPERHDFSHLGQTVESYFSWRSPLWWVTPEAGQGSPVHHDNSFSVGEDPLGLMAQINLPVQDQRGNNQGEKTACAQPIAGLWLGNAVDQVTGDRHGHIFMLYVEPAHRRRGIATALMAQAQQWGEQRGDRRLALQVFTHNQGAKELYEKFGFSPHALLMQKTW
ncbi:GNAT family N-acetyltransferase [Synechocystis salina]|uniref:GNAT family N-acetyltransferase n=1 Tax=Synechocystis salina LEGE 00031 TaxID=1828736 RepID=A0ABR9VXQ6_9SYNC|nr:GNAT family N-acetyltransferase [Synechocystis salina]MBE9241918.1 GNAT family N-acetyltransferase [Synechocystis salina LEGE 00041]MBE9255188.1 GNAT family N-acetyltransferase [Synechocystis salina LEGE 00031]